MTTLTPARNVPVTTCDHAFHDHASLDESVECASDYEADRVAAAAKADHDNGDCTKDPACCATCESEWDAEMDRRFEEYREMALEARYEASRNA